MLDVDCCSIPCTSVRCLLMLLAGGCRSMQPCMKREVSLAVARQTKIENKKESQTRCKLNRQAFNGDPIKWLCCVPHWIDAQPSVQSVSRITFCCKHGERARKHVTQQMLRNVADEVKKFQVYSNVRSLLCHVHSNMSRHPKSTIQACLDILTERESRQ